MITWKVWQYICFLKCLSSGIWNNIDGIQPYRLGEKSWHDILKLNLISELSSNSIINELTNIPILISYVYRL